MKPLFGLDENVINNTWKVLKIKRVLEVPITDGPHETPELLDEGIPFLSAESVKKGKLDFNLKRGYISQENHAKYIEKCKPQRDDIFMIKSGATTGNVAMVETDDEFSIWSPLALIRADKHKVIPKYLYYFISSRAFREQVEISWSFGTQQNIGMKVIENLFISLPPLNIQKQLVNYMENKVVQIDRLIEMKEEKIRLLEQQRQSIITEAVTKGLNPNVKMKDSGVEWIGEIPEHWEMRALKYCFKVGNGKEIDIELNADDETGINVYGSGGIFKKTDKILFEGESVLFGRKGTIGKPLYVNDAFWTVDTMYYTKFYKHSHPKWFYYLLLVYPWDMIVTQTALPSVVGSDVANTVCAVPSFEEQIEIAEYLALKDKKHFELIESINNQIEKLKEYRQALIYEAVTGKIDVRDMELN